MRSEEARFINHLELAELAAVPAWPARIGILNDYVRVPHANGSSFASQFLYREFKKRGHRVTVIGPDDPDTLPCDLPERAVSFVSLPLRNHPGVHLALPSQRRLRRLERENLDVVLAQTGSAMLEAGVWLRARRGVPLVCVNTIHLPSVYNVILPESLYRTRADAALREHVVPWLEQQMVSAYNQGDGLVVLASGLKRYWEQRGVTVPIHVVPRAVDATVFDAEPGADPFPAAARRGTRLLMVCRQTREKGVAHLLEIFAKFVAPVVADATLTLVGDGPDRDTFAELAKRLGIEQRVFFAGEQALGRIPMFLKHADVFVYTSLSETYGQVVSEAQWCRLPVVALADGMGVSQQVEDERTGLLIDPTGDPEQVKWRFAKGVLRLLHEPRERERIAAAAWADVRSRARVEVSVERYYRAFAAAREHYQQSLERAELPSEIRSLARWTGLHLTLAGMGLLRAPGTINRNHARQPSWDSSRLKAISFDDGPDARPGA
ncbi:MAG: glycosyltransferase [Polyangiaceae bacterium]|jgi:glycosyltransferase involved in cell wall biosynthesis|nr:glycosyltransferase [Polyangiaceae bacterium]